MPAQRGLLFQSAVILLLAPLPFVGAINAPPKRLRYPGLFPKTARQLRNEKRKTCGAATLCGTEFTPPDHLFAKPPRLAKCFTQILIRFRRRLFQQAIQLF